MKLKRTFRLPPDVIDQLAEVASRKRVGQPDIVEAALRSFMSPDNPEQLEAALSRRLDRIDRRIDALDQQAEITTEALALFVRFWLTANPPLPDSALAAAQAQGKERYDGFVEALARRLEGRSRLGDFRG
ncbi:MAG: CopG family transcriptional regulator [Sphingomonadales bacterium]|nr:CopG family transcriptional regulator [Sphingomonadales bacterium]